MSSDLSNFSKCSLWAKNCQNGCILYAASLISMGDSQDLFKQLNKRAAAVKLARCKLVGFVVV